MIEHGSMVTQDFKPDRSLPSGHYSEWKGADDANRLNVHLAEDGTVRQVDFK